MNNIKTLIACSLIGGPLLMLVSDTAGLIFEYPKLFWFRSIALYLSFYAFLGLIHGLYHLSNQTRLALVGTLLAAFGVLAGETIMGLERVIWAMHESGLQNQIENTVNHPIVFGTSRAIGITFPIGLIILSFSLFKAKAIKTITLVILLIGIILFPIGRIAVGLWANVPGDLIMLIIYSGLGIELLRQKI